MHGHQDVAVDGGAQRLVEDVGGQSGGLGEQVVGHPSAGRGRGLHDLAGGGVETVEPDQEQPGQVLGEDLVGTAGADQLLDEERVALGPVDDGRHLGLGQGAVGLEHPHEAAYVVARERLELEPLDVAQAGPLGDLAAQRVAAVQVVGAVGRHQLDLAREGAGEQEAEQVEGGPVGPVDVLDDEQQRPVGGGDVLEQGGYGVEEVARLEAALAVALGAAQAAAARLEPREGGMTGERVGDGVGLVVRRADRGPR